MEEKDLQKLISTIVEEAVKAKADAPKADAPISGSTSVENGCIPDIRAIDFTKINATPNPAASEEFMKLKGNSPMRLGVWRSGPRPRTESQLRFMADHAASLDAVLTDVHDDVLQRNNLFSIQSICKDKDEFLTRPDLGMEFSDETLAEIKSKCVMNPDVQIIFADGLSSTSVEANIDNLLPAMMKSLEKTGLKIGTPFFLKYGRVRSMDTLAQALGAKVTAICIGERPGLVTAESLSCYMCYDAHPGVPEANRTVVSNIYGGGTNPAEAGAYIAELLARMVKEKASGIDFKI